MRVLLSIKPEFVDKIFDGTKKYEFRKSLFKREDVSVVVLYASSPISRIVGEFAIEGFVNDDLESVWRQTKDYSGITEDYYLAYFKNRKMATAIQIGHPIKYNKALLLSDYNINKAPQSYCYIPDK